MPDLNPTASSPYETAMQRALEASQAHDAQSAVAALQEALLLEPGSAHAQFLLGAQYAQLDRMDEAERAFALAVVQDPDLHTARFQLGLLQLTRGKPAQAALTWQGLDTLPDTHALRIFAHGLIDLAKDDFVAADKALRHGIEANRDNHALNRDMQKVLEQIAHHLGNDVRESKESLAENEDSHFLLSTYHRQNLR
ncbi:hypothetical protein BWP39_29130 [Paraburkholderia acidicola]|uniref:Uncharacterized protein n=1 Tax=Paraburkholderia acidicola TaxID=1912599 RepID=A0A2A4ESC9_9BURK|nr:hypothetical protein [Paraburkholderia acidicola]PCE23745.1 hypothetical protein BWP39_29130 [Paraburkholderia acidicola]